MLAIKSHFAFDDCFLTRRRCSDMFLGPAHENFRFEPKHKANAYEVVAEG